MSEDVLNFPIVIKEKEFQNRLEDDYRIDKTNLDEEFRTQHEKFAYYATLHELAKDAELRQKKVMEDTFAHVDAEKRFEANKVKAMNSKFKYTESMCENECRLDARYQKEYLAYLDAKALSGKMGVQREAFSMRKDMLISLGANMRSNGSGDIRSFEHLKENYKKVTNQE